MTEARAAEYQEPFEHVRRLVKPMREQGNRETRKKYWWLHGETVPGLRARFARLSRYLATPRVAKHRFFVWLPTSVWPDSRLYVIARDDDFTFGVLSSRLHRVWSLANASKHGVGNDPTYNAKSCFETFPFPSQSNEWTGLVEECAVRLDRLRANWLNPAEWTSRNAEITPLGLSQTPYPDRFFPRAELVAKELSALERRTMTNLYNQSPSWLASAHEDLDAAVAGAYGWPYEKAMTDEDLLKMLQAENRARSLLWQR